jgi:PIN domain nuclease of toxin-antitoxin system
LRSSVLDSYAVLAYLFAEPGHEKVLSLLEKAADAAKNALISSPNWAEVRYIVKGSGAARWNEIASVSGLPIDIVPVGQ